MNGLRSAVALLTRVPMGKAGGAEPSSSIPWFPIVGAGVGLCVGGVYAGTRLLFPTLVAAALAVGAGVALTGAFHEDGLGDIADAWWGGWTREQRLEILEDPRLGTYGTLAILFAVLLRIFALAQFDSEAAVRALVAAHALSRTSILIALLGFRPASAKEGLGSLYARAASKGRSVICVGLGIGISVFVLGWWSAPAAGAAIVACLLVCGISLRKFGGITGDVMGAVEQASEVSILVVLSVDLR